MYWAKKSPGYIQTLLQKVTIFIWHLISVLSNWKFAMKKLLSTCKNKLYTSDGFPLFSVTLVSSYYHFLLLWFWSLYILASSKIILLYLSLYVTPCIMLFSFTCVVTNDRLSCFCKTKWFSTVSTFLFLCISHQTLLWIVGSGLWGSYSKNFFYLFSDIGEAFSFKL